MSGWKLPLPVGKFLRAAQSNKFEKLCAAIKGDTTVIESGTEFRGRQVQIWASRFCGAIPARVLPISCRWKDGEVLLVVLFTTPDRGHAESREWWFETTRDEIRKITIQPHLFSLLPRQILTFIHAANAGDLEMLLSTFFDDAIVNDQLYDYWGKQAIREWAVKDIISQHLNIDIVASHEHYQNNIVSARVSGDFDKRGLPDPLIFTFYFSVTANRIAQLIIVRNLLGV